MCDALHQISVTLSLIATKNGIEVKPMDPLDLGWMEDAHILSSADELRSLDEGEEYDHNRSRMHSLDHDGIELG